MTRQLRLPMSLPILLFLQLILLVLLVLLSLIISIYISPTKLALLSSHSIHWISFDQSHPQNNIPVDSTSNQFGNPRNQLTIITLLQSPHTWSNKSSRWIRNDGSEWGRPHCAEQERHFYLSFLIEASLSFLAFRFNCFTFYLIPINHPISTRSIKLKPKTRTRTRTRNRSWKHLLNLIQTKSINRRKAEV